MKYQCDKCKETKQVFKIKLFYNGNKWKSNVECCDIEMKQIDIEKGFPIIIRDSNDTNHSKK